MSCSYTVCIQFVDYTYWDDGSRWTRQRFQFTKQKEAVQFARTVLVEGCKVKGQNGEFYIRPEGRDISVERISTTQLNWQAL